MTSIYVDRTLAEPGVDPATEPYLAATQAGRFTLRQCTVCKKAHWYPRALCPFCMGDTDWIDSPGLGTIYSVSVTRKAGPTPFAIAYVTLDEGVTMLTNIVDCDLDLLKIGQRVKVCFKPAPSGAKVAMFTPI